MAVDAKGIIKDNGKLILSVVGIVVLAAVMSTATQEDGGMFGFWKIDPISTPQVGLDNIGPQPVATDDDTDIEPDTQNEIARPVDNGKNSIYNRPPEFALNDGSDYQADIITTMGTIRIDLLENIAPENVNNFIFLANDGFYSGTSFHRIVADYIIQGGDPLGTGYGGPGYSIDDEINGDLRFRPYSVAMANSESDTNGSQFFIVSKNATTEDLRSLDGNYTIIGDVVSGYNVIDDIEQVAVNNFFMPFDPVTISDVRVIER